jgi:protein-S-isoprenylcysteine O-methyltransferase Ste14
LLKVEAAKDARQNLPRWLKCLQLMRYRMTLPQTIEKILLFTVFVIVPVGLEQLAYFRFTPSSKAVEHRKVARVFRGYDLAYIWDTAHFFVLVAAGFRFIGIDRPFSAWEWIGCLVFICGVALRIWALRELGASYDSRIVIQVQQLMVTTGPYRLVRHPLYFGTTVQILGLSLLAPVWLGLPATLAALLLTLYMDRLEDRVLLKELPNYRQYYVQTWDLIDLIVRKLLPQE